MRYVQRDMDGKIVGHFANSQLGYAEEQIDEENVEFVAYLASKAPPPVRRRVSKALIVDRLEAAGRLDLAVADLAKADIYTRERWNTRTAIYADDPTAIALLKSIGADPNVILGA